MKTLRDIIYKTGLREIKGDAGIKITGISFDSRTTRPGDIFVSLPGIHTDGHLYIDDAVRAGATAIICEKMPEAITDSICYIRVNDSASALAIVAANFHDNPSEKIKLTGVTGTNGKTSVVSLLYDLFQHLGYPTGMITTIRSMVDKREQPATYTTPDPVQLNELLAEMSKAGCEYVFMEVSSHAVVQKRIEGIHFSAGVFTNLTHDHLDYHHTFKNYLNAKKAFFDNLPPQAFALTNIDDKNGMVMLQNTRATKMSYGVSKPGNFHAKMLEGNLDGMLLQIDNHDLWSRLIGRFNVYNLLGVYATARLLLDADPQEILTHLSKARPPEGRFELISGRDQIKGIVDYAHTPDALENVLNTINEIRSRQENLITVLGCGGNRDTKKRPLMASIAAAGSNRLILTSDNPRKEDPEKIIEEMKTGLDPVAMKRTIAIVNRKEAIRTACSMALKGDIILVAGKGHEKYQEINGIKYPFDDKELLTESLAESEF